jgi:phage baseplate assembly protein W
MAISINEIKSADWSFKVSTFGEVVEGYEDINQSINIILKTPKGADVFRPLFGAEITKYIDQPINQAGPQMVREILEALAIWETRIEVTSVNYTVENESINFEIRWILVENRQTGVANIAIQNAPAPELRLSAPPTPLNLSALIVNFSSVSLNWNYELSPIGSVFQIFRSIDGGAFQFIGSAYNSFTFLDSNLLGGNYEYKIRAAKGLQFSEFSNIAIAEIIPVFLFQTTWNTATDGAFDPSLTGGNKTWVFGTDTATSDSPNYSGSFLDGNLRTVNVISSDFSLITSANFSSYKIVGDLDVRLFNFNGSFIVDFNPDLTNIIHSFSNIISNYVSSINDSLTTLDLSNVTLTGVFQTSACPNLTSIIHSASNTVLNYRAFSCGLVGSLDLSNVTLTGIFEVYLNANLVTIAHSASNTVLNYRAFSCGLVGSLDLSNVTLTGIFEVYLNANLVTIAHSASNTITSYFATICSITEITGNVGMDNITISMQLRANSFNQSQADALFALIDANTVTTGLSNTLDFRGNTSPTGGAGNANIVSLAGKGVTTLL